MSELYEKKSCSRCPREETVAISLEQAIERSKRTSKVPAALSVVVDGTTLFTFERLCSECTEIVSRAVAGISKRPEKVSSTRERKAE